MCKNLMQPLSKCVLEFILNPKYNKQKFHKPSQNHLLEALASEPSRAERDDAAIIGNKSVRRPEAPIKFSLLCMLRCL